MTTEKLLRAFCDAVEQHDGRAFAALFAEDGVYHDVFYGAFEGRAKIAEMVDEVFYRTATDFRWDMHSPLSDGKILYARYTFSYRSTLPEAKGARVMFEGVAMMELCDGKIVSYHEVANTAPAFVDMNFAPERIAKILARPLANGTEDNAPSLDDVSPRQRNMRSLAGAHPSGRAQARCSG